MNLQSEPATIVVIGAGVIGLTTALRLLNELNLSRFNILIVSREWPTATPGTSSINYASMWAGAHIRPIPATTPQLIREAAWLKCTVKELQAQLDQFRLAGVTKCKGIELLEAPSTEYAHQTVESFTSETGLQNYRKFSPSELPEGVELGYEYDTFCINAPVYCASLLRSFTVRGGQCLDRNLTSEWEGYSVATNVALVINASGMGFGDSKCFPTKGQTVLTNIDSMRHTITKQNRDGSWNFVIPRFFDGGTIIGGTKEPYNYSSKPDLATRESLLSGAGKIANFMIPSHTRTDNAVVIADVVGRRPSREGGMRVEIEQSSRNMKGFRRDGIIIHAYGAGGRGFEISWGVAGEVVALVKLELTKHRVTIQSKL